MDRVREAYRLADIECQIDECDKMMRALEREKTRVLLRPRGIGQWAKLTRMCEEIDAIARQRARLETTRKEIQIALWGVEANYDEVHYA